MLAVVCRHHEPFGPYGPRGIQRLVRAVARLHKQRAWFLPQYLYAIQQSTQETTLTGTNFLGLFAGQVKPHGSGRIGSGQLTRPDPRKI